MPVWSSSFGQLIDSDMVSKACPVCQLMGATVAPGQLIEGRLVSKGLVVWSVKRWPFDK